MPSSKQRIDVWRGRRAKASGGLTKDMLIKNKRGKIVSKKKSNQAARIDAGAPMVVDTISKRPRRSARMSLP